MLLQVNQVLPQEGNRVQFLMLKASTFSSYDPYDGLIKIPNFKQGKQSIHHDGWFSYFFNCVEEVSDKRMSLNVMIGEEDKSLEDIKIWYHSSNPSTIEPTKSWSANLLF